MFVGLTPEGADAQAESEEFIETNNIAWPNGYGAGATIDALGVSGYPTVLVIGMDGKVVWNDEMSGELNDAIEKALAAQPTPEV